MEALEKDFEQIYLTVTGDLTDEVPWVREVSGGGEAYDQAWQALSDARSRLCQRFGMDWEDTDLEQILDAVSLLERDLGKRMFLCGIAYGKK